MEATQPESGEGALGLPAPARGQTVRERPQRRPGGDSSAGGRGRRPRPPRQPAVTAGAGASATREGAGQLGRTSRRPSGSWRFPAVVQSTTVAGLRRVSRPMGKFAVGWGGAEGRVAGLARFAHGPREGWKGLTRGLHAGPGRGPPPAPAQVEFPRTSIRAAPCEPRDRRTPAWGRGPRCGAAHAARQVGSGPGSGPGEVAGGWGRDWDTAREPGSGRAPVRGVEVGPVFGPGVCVEWLPSRTSPALRCVRHGPAGAAPFVPGLGACRIRPGRPAPRAAAETRPNSAACPPRETSGARRSGSRSHRNFPKAGGVAGPGNFPWGGAPLESAGTRPGRGISPRCATPAAWRTR